MANCVDVEDSAKRAASPAAFDSVRESSRTSASDRPAVIILDEAETETPVNGDPELTFGFEINEMLLSGSCTISSDEETDVKGESSPPVKMQPTISSLEHINLDKIVAFVGRGKISFITFLFVVWIGPKVDYTVYLSCLISIDITACLGSLSLQ